MSIEASPILTSWLQVGQIISVIAGVLGLFFALMKHLDKRFDDPNTGVHAKLNAAKQDLCKDIKEVKEAVKNVDEKVEDNTTKLNEHLITYAQGRTDLGYLKDTVKKHDSELEDLQRKLG